MANQQCKGELGYKTFSRRLKPYITLTMIKNVIENTTLQENHDSKMFKWLVYSLHKQVNYHCTTNITSTTPARADQTEEMVNSKNAGYYFQKKKANLSKTFALGPVSTNYIF